MSVVLQALLVHKLVKFYLNNAIINFLIDKIKGLTLMKLNHNVVCKQNWLIRSKEPRVFLKNDVLNNPNLSLDAKGLYATIESYIQAGFAVDKNFLFKNISDDIHTFTAAWNELRDYGYFDDLIEIC